MKVSELTKIPGITLLTGADRAEHTEITGCYIADLLSWVMAHAKTGNVWVTIMNHMNIIAVSSLLELACIIIAEGEAIEPELISIAEEREVILLSSKLSVFEIARELISLGI